MVPWYIKIPAKIVLSRSPIPRSLLNSIGIFRHGSMVEPAYALEIVSRHVRNAGADLNGATVLELGPGDSVGNGIIAYALGARGSCLVDAGAWATRDLDTYRNFVAWLSRNLPDPARLAAVDSGWRSFEELLAAFGIRYLTDGLTSLQGEPDHSFDFCFSEAVLEHIRVHEFDATFAQLRRLLKPGAVLSHVVDYKDHLQAGLNNMRFSRAVWEGPLFSGSGFYTNRKRHSDVLQAFERSGFELLKEERNSWHAVPIRRSALAPELGHYSDEILKVKEASLVLRCPGG